MRLLNIASFLNDLADSSHLRRAGFEGISLPIAGREGFMLTNFHYLTRRASRERRLAREALTDTARQRHASLAEHFAAQAQRAYGAPSLEALLAAGQD